MISVQKVIFPGIAAGCLFLVWVTSLIAIPNRALASYNPALIQPTATTFAPEPVAVEQAADGLPVTEEQPSAEEVPAVQPQAAVAGQCSIASGYPDSVQQWCGLIEAYAGQNGLDPNLVAAVILQESAGNSQAFSKSGAVGLMQVMPRDGKASGFMCINGPCFASRPHSTELYDPEFNISYGTRMLSGLIRSKGSVRDALRAYGPMDMGYRYADIILAIVERYR